ncbi:MAG: 4Fe-4S binding protein [Chloroflexi bacterium]|nr:4Fe-4S binding protein [Chloroflexota bacterium]
MDKLVYDQLTEALTRRGGGFPAVQCDVFHGLMDTIFTEDEAKLAAMLPDTPVSAEMLADQVKGGTEKVQQLLETMARKGILFSAAYADNRYYVMMPLIPGIIENQLLTGVVNERARKIARLFVDYLAFLNELESTGTGVFPGVPFARVIAVDRDIPEDKTVQPYDRLLPYIEKARYIGLVTCHCRHMYELLGDACYKPKDVCLAVGPGALYMSEYGLGKLISREEAYAVLKRAEDAGLAAISSFISAVDPGQCTGCGDCILRCPMEAVVIKDELACVEPKRCIGCGLCASACPTGAITLQPRANAPVPYPDARQLNAAIVSSNNLKKASI